MSQSVETTSREDLYDRAEINEILNRHQIYIDLKDADGYASLYAEDGRYESPFSSANGRAEIKAMFVRLAEQGFTKGKRHMSGPAMVDIAGNTATATSWYWVAETEQAPTVYATGTYTDTLRKIDGRWLITNRVQTLDPGASSNG